MKKRQIQEMMGNVVYPLLRHSPFAVLPNFLGDPGIVDAVSSDTETLLTTKDFIPT